MTLAPGFEIGPVAATTAHGAPAVVGFGKGPLFAKPGAGAQLPHGADDPSAQEGPSAWQAVLAALGISTGAQGVQNRVATTSQAEAIPSGGEGTEATGSFTTKLSASGEGKTGSSTSATHRESKRHSDAVISVQPSSPDSAIAQTSQLLAATHGCARTRTGNSDSVGPSKDSADRRRANHIAVGLRLHCRPITAMPGTSGSSKTAVHTVSEGMAGEDSTSVPAAITSAAKASIGVQTVSTPPRAASVPQSPVIANAIASSPVNAAGPSENNVPAATTVRLWQPKPTSRMLAARTCSPQALCPQGGAQPQLRRPPATSPAKAPTADANTAISTPAGASADTMSSAAANLGGCARKYPPFRGESCCLSGRDADGSGDSGTCCRGSRT